MDPASAIGVASAVWDVTKDLYTYYRAWKDCDNDVKKLRMELLWLHKAFDAVQKTLQKPGLSSEAKALIESAMAECNDSKDELEDVLNKIKKLADPKTLVDKLKAQGNVKSLFESLESCRDALHLAIDLLNLDTTTSMFTGLQMLDQRLVDGFHGIEDALQQLQVSTYTASSHAQEANNLKVLQWLNAPDQSRLAVHRQEPGTNTWFLDGPDFTLWRSQPATALALHGSVGCGKTTLLTALVEKLLCDPGPDPRLVIPFYFSGSSGNTATLDALLKDILAGIATIKQVPDDLQAMYAKHNIRYPPSQPQTAELEAIAQRELAKLDRDTCVLFDALDEVPYGSGREAALALLNALARHCHQRVHVLVTCRPQTDIIDTFRKESAWTIEAIPKSSTQSDIRLYVDNQITHHPRLSGQSPEVRAKITGRLAHPESDMFRWASLHLETLKALRPLEALSINATLDSLPSDLATTYERILADIDNKQAAGPLPKIAYVVLHWLSTPLNMTVEELGDACMVVAEDGWRLDEDRRMTAVDLLDLLPGLLAISSPFALGGDNSPAEGARYVTFAHFSVLEFLTARQNVSPAAFHFSFADGRHYRTHCVIAYLCHTNSCSKRDDYYPFRVLAWSVLEGLATAAPACSALSLPMFFEEYTRYDDDPAGTVADAMNFRHEAIRTPDEFRLIEMGRAEDLYTPARYRQTVTSFHHAHKYWVLPDLPPSTMSRRPALTLFWFKPLCIDTADDDETAEASLIQERVLQQAAL
ncbi:hypothetical protein LTR85_005704 [Meristemomyces frigidus]|nr:hypothetical protein LTR85_005704 [Meristemomyces frigidus]